MSDQPDPRPQRDVPLLFSLLGLVAAFAVGLWAGIHYMSNDASLFYGLIAGLSFGAAFAFGQQIKNRFIPPKVRKTDWKVQAPSAAELSSGRLAAQQARKISVEFDDQEIRTMVRGAKREGIAYAAARPQHQRREREVTEEHEQHRRNQPQHPRAGRRRGVEPRWRRQREDQRGHAIGGERGRHEQLRLGAAEGPGLVPRLADRNPRHTPSRSERRSIGARAALQRTA